MAKQALTVYSTNFRHRFDTMGHVLSYGQRPIVKTNITNILNNDDLPTGINVIVAIATYTGFNQEDSVILNKSALDRGLFNSTYYKTHKEINNKNHSNGEEEFFTKPDMNIVKNVKPYNYDKLDSSGFVPENTFVKTGDVIVGKVMPTKVEHSIQYKDNSTSMKNNESGFIDKNGASDKYFTNTNGDGYNFAKVRIRSDRTPTIGDKFCLPPSAEVLCKDGWKHINDVTCDDMVAQLNNGQLEYVKPLATYEFDHKGEMYTIKSHDVDLSVTMEHKMYVSLDGCVSFQLVEAKMLIDQDAHYKNMNNSLFVDKSCTSITQYDGKVYCIEVPSHVFYVRMNGKPVWTGNSSRHGQLEAVVRESKVPC
jgi:DNA-directed RNA polymerase II subunit RPB2